MSERDEQWYMDLEDVALRHDTLVNLLLDEQTTMAEINRLTVALAAAKRRHKQLKRQLQDTAYLERKKSSLKKKEE